MSDLSAPLTDLKGIGDKTAKLFDACGVHTVEELCDYFPRAYDSFSTPVTAAGFAEGRVCAVSCTILRAPALRYVKRYAILTADATDGTETFHATWFNQPYLKNSLYPGRRYVFRGLIRKKGKSWLMEQPGIYSPEDYAALANRLLPRYPLVKGLKNNTVVRTVQAALPRLSGMTDPLPEDLRLRRGLLTRAEAIRAIHFPENEEARSRAHRRLAYDEFLDFLLGIRMLRGEADDEAYGICMEKPPSVDRLIGALPYALTGAQKRVLDEMLHELADGRHMHRLVQGDVGSGKTILALLLMLVAVENGYQTALMAPTQVLAAQHYETFLAMTEQYDLPFHPVLLSGTLRAAERRKVLEEIADGTANCVIGTNALMQESVSYARLGLVVTDEQHRFGVRQRVFLADKGERPHILVMSATPIPRTLAMILYGDLHVSLLDELPAGRKHIKNAVVGPEYRPKAYQFIAEQVSLGRQAYVICPMVEEGELEGAENVADETEKLRSVLPASVRVDALHGRMKPDEKDRIMERFAAHETDVLVSTTVVEVGVNVPNATVMMIENAERFGLAGLHQLRGRVGRGEEQSYCIFVNTSASEEAAARLEILKNSNDGFAIADQDLKLRGPGDLFGVRQSGAFAFRVADIYADATLLKEAAEDADRIAEADPELAQPENRALAERIRRGSQIDIRSL